MTDERDAVEDGPASSFGDTGPAPSGTGAPAAEAVEEDDAAADPVSPLRSVPACVLGWLLPGLGHLVLGRVMRGLGFALVVVGLFVGGIALDGKVYRPVRGEPLSYLATLGAAGVGLPYAVAHLTGVSAGEVTSRFHDYGTTFTLVAGLLNLLVIIDAYDVAVRRR